MINTAQDRADAVKARRGDVLARVREFLRIVPIGRPHVGDGTIVSVSGLGHLTIADLRELLALAATVTPDTTPGVLGEVATERARQEGKWGEQNHPNGTGGEPGVEPFGYCDAADLADWLTFPPDGTVGEFLKHRCQVMTEQGDLTYEAVLTEEWGEAISESDPTKLRVELIQVAAVAVAWVEKIDRDLTRDQEGSDPGTVPAHATYRDETRASDPVSPAAYAWPPVVERAAHELRITEV